MSKQIDISFVCPVFNEENSISDILDFFEKQDPDRCELILVDGGSSDGTKKIIEQRTPAVANVILLNNEQKYQNFALNIGIKAAKGKWIIRLDAHTKYSSNYADAILNTFEKVSADIVGGPMRAVGEDAFRKAVAYATEQKFGIGDSAFHNEAFEGETESVYLGAYSSELPSEIGYYDEDLVCNEDDEFAYRARAAGKIVYQNPEIRSWYSPRASFTSLFRQYFRYGFYKPLVFIKTSSGSRARHWIPSLFFLYLIMLPLIPYSLISLVPGVLYILLNLHYSLLNKMSIEVKLLCLIIFPCLHIAYGSGFLAGSLRWYFNISQNGR